MTSARAIWIFVVLHLVLAIVYASITPYRQGGVLVHQRGAFAADIGAPDERQHVNYVAKLAHGQGFQVLNPQDPNLYENYQAHQPPLFYVLGDAVMLATPGAALPDGEVNGKPLRYFNALVGAVTVLGVYFFVLWGYRHRVAALAAAAFAALLPMNVALSGAVSNDPLLYCLCTWCLAFAAKGISDGWSWRIALTAGLLMAAAFLTKTTAVALWPAVAVGYFLSTRQSKIQNPKSKTPTALLLLALPLVLAAPWWLRNQQLYGDPLAMSVFNAAFKGSPQAADFLQFPGGGPVDYWITGSVTGTGVAWWTLRSFFGVFGYMDIFLPGALYAVLALVVLVLLVARFWKGRAVLSESDGSDRSDKTHRSNKPHESDQAGETHYSPLGLMSGLFFLLVLVLFLRFNAQYFQGQARYLFPAIAPISATLGIGAVALFGTRKTLAPWALAVLLVALNIYVLTLLPGEFALRTGGALLSQ